MPKMSKEEQMKLAAASGAGVQFEAVVLTEKQKMRNMLLTNREAVKEELKAMSPFEIFALFDDDDSGLIDFDEFKRMLPFLDIYISDLKAFRYFRICDSDGSGEIDIDEFKVALFICDPTSGNPVGYIPTSSLTPTDAFEVFDEDQSGFLDEDEFFYAMEYMALNPTDHKHEKLFTLFDNNHQGSIDYYEFREVFLMMCDVRKELEDRGVDVPTFARRKTLVEILRGLLDEEERRERSAIAEAIRFKKWIMAVREKKKVLQKASFRAYQELRNALDAAGHVYAFGGGTYKQFESASTSKLKTQKFDFQLFDRVLELWKDRVKPEQLIDRLKAIRKLEEQEAQRDLDRGDDGMGALGKIAEGKQVIIDPYKEALISGFVGLNVSMNTASLWGRRVHHVSVTENVAFALAETGELFTWGGNSYWWHEIQPDSLYQTKWRGDTTARSQLLLGTLDKELPPDASLDNITGSTEELSEEEKVAETIKVVSKYYDVWEPPPNPATRMIYLTKELLPKIEYDGIKFSLSVRGKDMGEKNKMELMEELYEDIITEKKLLGERAHKAIRELETQIQSLQKRKKDKLADKFLKRIDDMWLPLREVQAEQRAAEIARKLAAEHNAAHKVESDYQNYRERLLDKRESIEAKMTPRGNSLQIDLSGVTPRGPPMRTPRGFQSAIQISTGTAHAMLVHKSGQLYAWGMGAAGRLGLDVTEDGDPQKDVVQPRLVQALVGRPVLRVDCGYSHTGCIVAGGDLYMWGSAGTGKCGLGEITNTVECYCSIPTRVMVGNEDRKVRRLSCGSAHTACVTENGQLYIFGCGDGGRLGLGKGKYDTMYVPVHVTDLSEERIVNVSCGNTTTFALTECKQQWVGKSGARFKELTGGVVFMAGSQNVLGKQCDTFVKLDIPNKPAIKMVSAGFQHTAMVSSDGELFTFGFNKRVCCGNNPDKHFVPTPSIVGCLYSNASNIALGCKVEMSSEFNSREGKYAVNGETDGHGTDKCACTHQESQAWLELDLGKMAVIEEIRLWNRTDVPRDRHLAKDSYTCKLFPCWVMIGRVPFDPQTNEIGIKNNIRDAVSKTKFTENQRMSSWHPPSNIQGRYIRVQLENYEQLCVAELEVFGNFGLNKGVGRVSYAVAGRDVTVAVVRPTTDPADVEAAYRRATYADAGNADILRQLETYALEYDKFGRGEVLMKTCDICKGDVKCEACALYEVYADEIKKIPPGIGGRRRRLKSIDEFLININKPDLVINEIPRHKRLTKRELKRQWWRQFGERWGLVRKRTKGEISPEEALEISPEGHLEKIVFEEEAKARAEDRDAKLDVEGLLVKPEKDSKKSKSKKNLKVTQIEVKNKNNEAKMAKLLNGEEQEEENFDFDGVGDAILDPTMNQHHLRSKISPVVVNSGSPSTWKPGDMLLTGQIIKDVIPKSISGPASEADKLLGELKEEEDRKKAAAENAAARNAAVKVTGNIS